STGVFIPFALVKVYIPVLKDAKIGGINRLGFYLFYFWIKIHSACRAAYAKAYNVEQKIRKAKQEGRWPPELNE
ncbi:MAG: hypothetical protein Q7J20_01125, partial [Candidatus Nitrotoga sp.]|nr:hypothetical protein [Candidatus Nitrotoga sp.]